MNETAAMPFHLGADSVSLRASGNVVLQSCATKPYGFAKLRLSRDPLRTMLFTKQELED